MTRTLYIASSNPGKLRDFALAAARQNLAILPLPGLDSIDPPPEDAPTFEGNARDKAVYYSRYLPGEMVLADDSGLEVDRLQGAPGVRSARFAADAGAEVDNNQFLLLQLAGEESGARYRCALAVARDGTVLETAEGTVEGRIVTTPRGRGGFGYDPLFYLPTLQRTMAEISDEARWEQNHRGKAFRALLQLIT
jgi:XTP/dITP diphosphohydrolase